MGLIMSRQVHFVSNEGAAQSSLFSPKLAFRYTSMLLPHENTAIISLHHRPGTVFGCFDAMENVGAEK